jgi:hypothetical protein
VPDGGPGTEPVRVRGLDGDAIEILWDNQCPASGPTKIVYGPMHLVSEYRVLNALCDIPADAEGLVWERPFFGSFWFLVLKDSGLGVESSWGRSSSGERNGTVHSGQCGTIQKNTSTTCP